MRKPISIFTIALAALSLSCVALAGNPFANPDEPHGVIRVDARLSAHQIYPVDVLAIDDDLVSVAGRNAIWLKPGKYILTVRSKVDLSNTFGIMRTYYDELPNDVTVTVEEGKIYYVGMKAIKPSESETSLGEVMPVVWKVSSR